MTAVDAARVTLLCLLDEARRRDADAWCVVTVDCEDGSTVHATGPFREPEQALVEAGRLDADWQAHAQPEEGSFAHVVVPLWRPA